MNAKLDDKLANIVGLHKLKEQLKLFSQSAAMNQIRQNQGIDFPIKRPVLLFTGNPGTGKTSIATIVAGKENTHMTA